MQLNIQSLSKQYGKGKFGLQNFSLTINKGILGLLGPNGAGKTTLMKMIATISKPTHGNILLNGTDIVQHPNTIRRLLGFLPQDFGIYPNLNAYEFLEYIAAMKGVGGAGLKSRIEQLLEGLNLIENAKKPIGSYSGGMKQRIGIAQALLNNPKVLIFDEPTVGLDPEERVRFRNLIADIAEDSIVILSSHIVSDIETIADTIVIMKNGQLIATGTQQEIIQHAIGKVFESEIESTQLNDFKNKYMVVNTIRKKDKILVRYITDKLLSNANNCVASLEDAYLFLTKQNS